MNYRFLFIGLSCLLAVSPTTNADGKKPPPVEVAQPVERDIVDYVNPGPGHVEATEHVDLYARVTGYVAKVNFKPGANVKKGDVLFEVDNRPYRAVLEAAEARLAVAEAHVNLTKNDLDRAAHLLPKKAISQEDFERSKANHIEAKAKLIVAVAELQHAKLNFEFTRISAPIDGIIGETKITAGNLVKADDTLLASIDSVGPVHVRFQLDERTLLRMRQLLKGAAVHVKLGRAEDADYPHEGTVDFVDSRVDPKTGDIHCRATFANAQGTFLPGMRAFVLVTVSAPYKSLMIDNRAYHAKSAEPFRDVERHVFVVTEKNVVEARKIEFERRDSLLAIKSGLTATDLVIVDGFPEMKVGMKVTPKRVAMQIPTPKATKKDKTPEAKPEPAKLKELLKERHAVLTKVADLVAAQYQHGTVSLDRVADTQRALIESGLELAETPMERVVLLRKLVKLTETLNENAQARFKAGAAPETEVLQIRALLLDARIRLVREEEKAKANK